MSVIENERRVKMLVAAKLAKAAIIGRTNMHVDGGSEARIKVVMKIYADILKKL